MVGVHHNLERPG